MPEQTEEIEGHQQNAEPFLRLKKRQAEQRLNSLQFTWWGWLLSACVGGISAVSLAFLFYIKPLLDEGIVFYLLPKFFLGAIVGSFMYSYVIFVWRTAISGAIRRLEIDLLQYDSEILQENIQENFFTKLVQINFKYIDQYYLQTQEQANKSFSLARFASLAGLGIVSLGIIMMLFDKTNPAYVTTGAGVISEFIAAIFFYLYNKTILKMSQYHQKLVITQNISLALKITDEMKEDDKAKSLQLLVERLTTDVNKHLTTDSNN